MATQSYFHLRQGKEFVVKELFKDISKLIKKHYQAETHSLDILDIGCASGELLYFLMNDLQTSGAVTGFDISAELITNAKERFGDSFIEFFVADAADFNLNKQFDVLTMTSVLSYFADPAPLLANMLKHLKNNGLAIVTGIFNDWNIEVRMKYKLETCNEWRESAVINQFGTKNIKNILNQLGFEGTFTKQIMPFDIEPKEHPIRSWTVLLPDGTRRLTNGLQLLYDIQILQITKLPN